MDIATYLSSMYNSTLSFHKTLAALIHEIVYKLYSDIYHCSYQNTYYKLSNIKSGHRQRIYNKILKSLTKRFLNKSGIRTMKTMKRIKAMGVYSKPPLKNRSS